MQIEEWLGKDNALGIDIWHKKYQHDNESLDDWFKRVSGGDEAVEKLIKERKFLFGGRILANRGLKNGSLSNCYVLSVKDSIESIYDTAGKMAQTYKSGGGVGIDIGNLAPSGSKVNNPAKTSSGAVSFIELFTTTTGLIGQNGRRGALMVSIPCDHPDIEDFIKLKTDVTKATTANLSIRVSDDFMRAVENNEQWYTSFVRPETGETIYKEYNARELFKTFCDANYDFGEPALLFWDRIEKYNMLDTYKDFKFAGVNPCAEEPLPDGGACLLGSMNLAEYVDDIGSFDMRTFKRDVVTCVKALNNVQKEGIELHPLDIQKQTATDWKQIGLGIMGLGDMLVKMGIKYGSERSLEICENICERFATYALVASEAIAQEENASFPRFDSRKTSKSSFWTAHMHRPCDGIANSQILTIAPTGTLSTMLGISSGIEPLFALEYDRTTKSLHGKDVAYKVIPEVVLKARKDGRTDGLVSAHDIDYLDRIKMQSVWQKHIDASISSTINLPEDFPKEKIQDLYLEAWKHGLKGVTVFRDGCKRAGILTTKKEEKQPDKPIIQTVSDNVIGKKRKLTTGCGSLHCTAFFEPSNGNLLEVYLNKGSTGGCNNFMIGLSRMISLASRSGCNINDIVDQLDSCGSCPSYAVRRATKGDTSKGACCPMAVGNALIEMHDEIMESINGITPKAKTEVLNPCPKCGEELTFEGGCNICKSCGWTKCE